MSGDGEPARLLCQRARAPPPGASADRDAPRSFLPALRVPARGQQVPELLRSAHSAGETAAHRDDRDRIVGHRAFRDVPFLLEVPGFDGKGPDKANIDLLKQLRAEVGVEEIILSQFPRLRLDSLLRFSQEVIGEL